MTSIVTLTTTLALLSLSMLVLQVSSDSPPAPRFTCPTHVLPVCTGDYNDFRTTFRNECVYATIAADGLVNRILHRGPCKGSDEFKWSGWERDEDDIPANYEAYKLKYPNSKY